MKFSRYGLKKQGLKTIFALESTILYYSITVKYLRFHKKISNVYPGLKCKMYM